MNIEKERKIRSLIAEGTPVESISFQIDISTDTVRKRMRMYSSLESIGEEKIEAVGDMLSRGIPAGKIEIALQIPVKMIRYIRLLDEIMERYKEPEAKVCPSCGSLSWPGCQTGYTRKVRNDSVTPDQIDGYSVMEMKRVVLDLLCLSDLHVIQSPLFHDLSRQAESVIKRINDNAKR